MSFILELTVVPRSSINKFVLEENGLKLKVTSPPVEGEANKKIIEILAKEFSCAKTSIKLHSGEKSKHKKFIFQQLSQDDGQVILNKIIDKR